MHGKPPFPDPIYKDIRILLASNSPRRRELLALIVPAYDIAQPRQVDETYPATLAAADVPAYLSQLKASAYADTIGDNELLITADTVVILNGKIFGKPHDRENAIAMLQTLAGRTHTVVTGVTLTSRAGKKFDTFSVATEVTFAPLTSEQIISYVDSFTPYDKAGAYGIQEWIGGAAIENINGSFYNVMGLPLHVLYNHLRDFFA